MKDNFDKKIKLILSKKLDIPQEFGERITCTINNLPKYSLDIKNSILNRFINTIKIFILTLLSLGTIVLAYTGIKNMQNNLEQTVSEVNNKISVNTYYDENGIEKKEYHFEGFFDTDEWNSYNIYKFLIITNIEEYNIRKEEYKDKFELEEMTEKDFENKNLLLIQTFGDVSISNIKEEEEILYIDIERHHNEDNNYVESKKVISIKLEKNSLEKEIKINTYPASDNYSIKPTIKELVESNYTKEQAVQDGCIVTEVITHEVLGNKVDLISNNIEKFNNFIEETKNGKEMEIRLIHYSTNITRFIDIKYEDNCYKSYIYEKESPHKMLGEIEAIISDSQYFKRGKEIEYIFDEDRNLHTYNFIGESILKVGDMERIQEDVYPILQYNNK